MFQQGKKYKHKLSLEVFKCVWTNATHAALFNPNKPNLSDVRSHEDCDKWYTEYVEPIKCYVNVWRRKNGSLYLGGSTYPSRHEATRGTLGTSYVDTVEVTYGPK